MRKMRPDEKELVDQLPDPEDKDLMPPEMMRPNWLREDEEESDAWGDLQRVPMEEKNVLGALHDVARIAFRTTESIITDGRRLIGMARKPCPKCGATMDRGVCLSKKCGHTMECPNCGLPLVDGLCSGIVSKGRTFEGCGYKVSDRRVEDTLVGVARAAQVTGRVTRTLHNYGPSRRFINKGLTRAGAVVTGKVSGRTVSDFSHIFKTWKREVAEPTLGKRIAVEGPSRPLKDDAYMDRFYKGTVKYLKDAFSLSDQKAMDVADMCISEFFDERLKGAPIDDLLAAKRIRPEKKTEEDKRLETRIHRMGIDETQS